MRSQWIAAGVAVLLGLSWIIASGGAQQATAVGGATSPLVLPVYPAAELAQWEPKFRRSIEDNYRRVMLPALTTEEAAALRKMRFNFPTDPGQVTLAFRATSAGTIELPVASLLLLKDLSGAEAWLTANRYTTFPLLEYLSVIRLGRLGQWPTRDRLPLPALGIPPGGDTAAAVLARRDDTLNKTILFVVGHEMGHLIHGLDAHGRCAAAGARCNVAQVRAAEAKADAFAVDLFRRIGIVPSGSNFLFLIASRLQPFPSEFAGAAAWQRHLASLTHPLDSQRIATVARLIAANRDGFAAGMPDSVLGRRQIDTAVVDLRTLASNLDDRSLGATQLARAKTLLPQDLRPRTTLQPALRPAVADRAATRPFTGYYRGAFRQASGGAQPVELLFRSAAGGSIDAELMLMGIRGAISGRLPVPTQIAGTMDIGGDPYDVRIDASSDGRKLSGDYRSRTNPNIRGRIEARRGAAAP